MKKKTSIIIAVMLAVLPLFAACTNVGQQQPQGGENGGPKETASGERNEDETYREILPDNKYDGVAVNILMGPFAWFDMYVPDGETGETMNDAVYLRNRIVEERLGVELNVIFTGDEFGGDRAAPMLINAIKAGDNIYDIYMPSQVSMLSAVREGYIAEFDKLSWVDLEKPWWDDHVTEHLNFGNKVYFGVSDTNFTNLGHTNLMLFNKNLFGKENIPYPYDLVRSGDWTFDAFAKIVRDGRRDLDGDGSYDIKDDQFGFSGWHWAVGPDLYTGMGGILVVKGADGMPELTLATQKSFDIFERIVAVFNEYGGYYNDGRVTYAGLEVFMVHRQSFIDGRTLMIDERPIYLDFYRGMQDDFGIIPHPKYDSYQENYLQLVSSVGTYTGVPVICKDFELASAVLEALAAESYRSVMPKYYETRLQIKLVRDDESADMIDIIAKSRVCSLALDSLDAPTVFTSMIPKNDANLESFFQRNEGKIQAELDKVIEAYLAD